MKKAVLVVGSVLVLAAFAGARGVLESGDAIEGRWTRDEAMSDPLTDLGGVQIVRPRVTLTIARAGNGGKEITVRRTVTVSSQRDVRELTYSTAGGQNVNFTARGVEIHSTSSLDRGTLAIEGRGEVQTSSGRAQQFLHERWTLSPNGRILTIVSVVTVPGRDIRRAEVFTRWYWWW